MATAILLTGLNSYAEEKLGSACEKVLIHTNKTVYTAGEDVFYRIYSANPLQLSRSVESRILYFSMKGSRGQNLQWRINLSGGETWGRYRLPEDLNPGVYQLTVYTSQMRNLPPDSLQAVNLLITSLIKDLPDTLLIPPLAAGGNTPTFRQAFTAGVPGTGPVVLSAGKNEYAFGESLVLKVRFNGQTNDTARLSVSVSLAAPMEESDSAGSGPAVTPVSKKRAGSGRSTNCLFPLENRGYIVSGQVIDKESNTPVISGKVLLSVADTLFPRIRFARTDSAGRFVFYLDPWYDNRELILQTGDTPGLGIYEWRIDTKGLPYGQTNRVPYVMNEADRGEVQTQIKARLIEAVYTPVPESKPPVNPRAGINYFVPSSFSVAPADFQELVNFKEIADNILPGVKFLSRNKSYLLQVINGKSGQWFENQMVLLNGIPFTDFSYLATLGSKDISRIDVITSDFIVGDFTFHGLVSVYTHNGIVPESFLKSHGVVLKNDVAETENTPVGIPSGASGPGEHDPDYRTGLLWLPDLKIQAGKEISIPVTVSHTPGVYNVVVNGMSHEGTPLSATAIITIK